MSKSCCGIEAVWVENIPGKGYLYCRECKNEVVEKVSETGPIDILPVTISGTIAISPPLFSVAYPNLLETRKWGTSMPPATKYWQKIIDSAAKIVEKPNDIPPLAIPEYGVYVKKLSDGTLLCFPIMKDGSYDSEIWYKMIYRTTQEFLDQVNAKLGTNYRLKDFYPLNEQQVAPEDTL